MAEYEYTPLTKMDTSVDVISGLGNRPNVDNGLRGDQLRAKFDESANDIKNFLNGYTDGETPVPGLIDELNDKLEALETTVDGLVAGTVTDDSVYTAAIQDLAVSNAKLSENAVTSSKLLDGAVTTGKLDSKAVTTAKLADGAVDTLQLADTAVTHAKLGANAVEAGNIKDGEVTNDKLADSTIAYGKTNGTIQKRRVADVGTLPSISSANGTQTVNVSGVTASNVVLISPTASSWQKWRDCGVRCTDQGSGTLTFKAESATNQQLTFNYVILD